MANQFGRDSPTRDDVTLPPMVVVAAAHDLLRDHATDYAAEVRQLQPSVLAPVLRSFRVLLWEYPCSTTPHEEMQSSGWGDVLPHRI